MKEKKIKNEKRSQKEIARLLNKSKSSIENLTYRAREQLKKEAKKIYNHL